MDLFDEIIANFELEKELGVRTAEIDRALLLPPKREAEEARSNDEFSVASAERRHPLGDAELNRSNGGSSVASAERRHPLEDAELNRSNGGSLVAETAALAFLTAGELSADGEALLAKMMLATKLPAEKMLRLKEGPFAGGAKVAVVMGSDALRAYAPGARAGLGAWTTLGKTPAVVTYSPDRLLRFFANDPAKLRDGKMAVWKTLQDAMKRAGC